MFPRVGVFMNLFGRNSIYRDDGRAKKGRQWRLEQNGILATGNRIRLAVNGQLVADWEDPKPESCIAGRIGCNSQHKVAQEVRFRGLMLSENPEIDLLR